MLWLTTQTANIVLTAQGYSAVYNGDYLSALYSSTGSGSSVLSSAFNDAVVPTNIQPVCKEVPVTLTRAAVSTCTTWGDPHVTTYDGWGYHPQVQGELLVVLVQHTEAVLGALVVKVAMT